jgi:hypothetical protein
LAELSGQGYVKKIEDGKYSVSDRGEIFLAGVPDATRQLQPVSRYC